MIRAATMVDLAELGFPPPPDGYPLVWEPGDAVALRPTEELLGRCAVLNAVLAGVFGAPPEVTWPCLDKVRPTREAVEIMSIVVPIERTPIAVGAKLERVGVLAVGLYANSSADDSHIYSTGDINVENATGAAFGAAALAPTGYAYVNVAGNVTVGRDITCRPHGGYGRCE